ncbi:MAG: tetratricopeptide repeat protein [Peptococcaceae bacterium]|nr:tetratricopeptide repeat protein [Peptococcaceae bacterium]
MRSRTQKITVIAIIVILCVALIGSSFYAIFLPDEDLAEDPGQQALVNEYNQWQQAVDLLNQRLAENPTDLQAKIDLGDAYYAKSEVTAQLNVDEYKEDLINAIKMYQDVLQAKEDDNIRLKMANAAFFVGDAELASSTYEELLANQPENPEVLFGYGMCLLYLKDDYKQALHYWRQALPLVEDQAFKEYLQEMINLTEGMESNSAQE